MAAIHFMLQGKGGVGKSLVASMLAQYFASRELDVRCFDTDPINATFAAYKELNVTTLDIMQDEDIDPRGFDQLMEKLLILPEEAQAVVDNGAASFVPLGSYLLENQALGVLEDEGHSVMLHTVITGGQAILDTLAGLQSLAAHFPDTPIVVWLNRYFGDISMGGKGFFEFKVYSECSANFHAVIDIPDRKQATFGRDLEELFSSRRTFETAIHSQSPIMVKQRLKTFWREACEAMDRARLV
jgi:hypothetical protein